MPGKSASVIRHLIKNFSISCGVKLKPKNTPGRLKRVQTTHVHTLSILGVVLRMKVHCRSWGWNYHMTSCVIYWLTNSTLTASSCRTQKKTKVSQLLTLIVSRVQFVNLWPHFKAFVQCCAVLYYVTILSFSYFKGCYEVLLFLPPQYHILLKCSPDDSTSVVEIATDHWMLLPFIGDWLKNTLMSSWVINYKFVF